jgi:D-threonine aldolase
MQAIGHHRFCTATIAEIEGMVAAGVGSDLLLANEVIDYRRLGVLVEQGADITVAVDSDEVLVAVVAGGVKRVLIDVEVGLPRCGCDPSEAGRLADAARAAGLEVRGVMGYEGHLMMVPDADRRKGKVEAAMALLLAAHDDVGGAIVSGGGTGTYAVNEWVTEVQAGSYCLMDTQYATLEVPFEVALSVLASVVSVSAKGWAVADAGLKAFAMDHGNPTWPDGELRFCSDEHSTLSTDVTSLKVGDKVRLLPAHIDPTIAKHERMWVVDGEFVVDQWPIDLRHW